MYDVIFYLGVFFLVFAGACAVGIVSVVFMGWVVNRKSAQHELAQSLLRKRSYAHAERIRWLYEHQAVSQPFGSPDYQKLWREELDTEDRLNALTREHSWTSWQEYEQASREQETQ